MVGGDHTDLGNISCEKICERTPRLERPCVLKALELEADRPSRQIEIRAIDLNDWRPADMAPNDTFGAFDLRPADHDMTSHTLFRPSSTATNIYASSTMLRLKDFGNKLNPEMSIAELARP